MLKKLPKSFVMVVALVAGVAWWTLGCGDSDKVEAIRADKGEAGSRGADDSRVD